jgi:pilus assembly protein CpaF
LEDETITEIMVNGAKNIHIERKGKLHRVPVTFENNDHVLRIIDRIVAPLGRRIDEASPYVDARLPDGSRVNAVIAPISLVGPVLTIRKFSRNPITVEQMIQ